MNLAEAFALYGAEGPRRTQRLSAVARDGAIILGCSARRFSRPAAGVLRYQDVLPEDPTTTSEAQKTLRQHLELARTGGLAVRLIVITESGTTGSPSRTIHVRQDLVGSVVDLDAGHYVVDFIKAVEPR